MVRSFRSFLSILLLLPALQLPCQISLEALTVADGLSQGFVTSIIQDAKGFLWLGTFDGMNRYDGYSIRQFKPRPFDPYSLQASYITCLLEDKQGYIWVGTSEGLQLFCPQKERFYNITGLNRALPGGFISHLTGDGSGNVFVQISLGKNAPGLFQLRLPPGFLADVPTVPESFARIAVTPIKTTQVSARNLILLDCIGDTLVLLRDDANHFFRYSHPAKEVLPMDLNTLPSSNSLDHSILWGKYKSYIFRIKQQDGSSRILPFENWEKVLRIDNDVYAWLHLCKTFCRIREHCPLQSVLDLPEQKLVGTPEFKREFEVLIQHKVDPLLKIYAWNEQLLADRSGIIWLGTSGFGARKVNPRQTIFGKAFTGKSVSSLRELPGGRIWVRLFNNRNFLFDPKTGLEQPIEATLPAFLRLSYFELFVDSRDMYWGIAAPGRFRPNKRLFRYDSKSGSTTLIDLDLPFQEGVLEKIVEDHSGAIWIAANGGNLYRFRPGNLQPEHFSYDDLINGVNTNILRSTALAEDPSGTIWIGCNHGLLRVDHADSDHPSFRLFQKQEHASGGLNINWVTSICPDPAHPGWIWLGTRGGGINRLDADTGRMSYWTESPNGLPDNVVYGILPDESGNFWCSTNRGICRFNPASGIFVSYMESDGLSSTEFNTNAYLRTCDGRMWFGGVNGLNFFDPRALQPRLAAPQVAITAIKVLGHDRLPDQAGRLTLSFEENNVSFEFAALDFAHPSTNRFRHRLKGIDREWVEDGTAHIANYAALPPGCYEFELQGAVSESAWANEPLRFTLVICPPWYRHRLAYIAYALLFAALIYGTMRYRMEMFRLHNIAELNRREAERLKAFEHTKNQFFVNIAHELRTPLSLIMGQSERIQSEGNTKGAAQQIARQADQLLRLSEQVLDLARLESRQLQLHPIQDDIIAFFHQHMRALQSLAASRNIGLEIDTTFESLEMEFDPQQLQKVLNNLVSNAVRHTPKGGSIVLKIESIGDLLRVQVADNGEGIAPEDIDHVFDRYYQGNKSRNAVGASGIGLTLTRDLVHCMGGTISVESRSGEGAVFTFLLPIRKNAAPAIKPVSANVPETTVREKKSPLPAQLPLLLLVEDNPNMQFFLRSALEPHYRIVSAEDGKKGLEKALECIPDLILTDVAMPNMDGYTFTSAIKEDERTSHIPVAMLSAKAEITDRLEGRLKGANAYLTKPFSISELLLVLNNLMQLQQQWKLRYEKFPLHPTLEPGPAVPEEEIQSEDQFMQKIYAVFETHYHNDDFHLDQLCKALNISSSQLDRKLKALVEQAPMQLLRSFRLKKARALLQAQPELSIKEVCFRTGFNSPSHFSRLYSKEFGVPPSKG